MKTYHYVLGTVALAALAIPILSQAQTPSIRDQIRTDIEARTTNIANNRDVRNDTLEAHMGITASTSSSTMPHMPPRPGIDGRPPMMASSTTPPRMGTSTFPGMGRGRGDQDGDNNGNASSTDNDGHRGPGDTKNLLKVRKDIFDMQKNHLIDQLNKALTNLTQIRGRIAERITTAQSSGRDMTNAKALLVTADAKIAAAQIAINALATLSPTATTTTQINASTTVDIDLGKPRQVGAAAISSVEDARHALNAVVVAIARSMGFKIDADGHITATTTPTI